MPKVTIIIPNYNHAQFLVQRLDSIYNQTFKNWEAIIIDDASTDKSLKVIERYLDEKPNFRVKQFIKNKINSGSGYKSWQKGIALADTEFIWIAETDDYCTPTFLDVMIKSIEINKKVSLCFSSSNYVNVNGGFLYNSLIRTLDLDVLENEYAIFNGKKLMDRLPFNTYIINGSSVVFRNPKAKIPKEIFFHKQNSDIFLWTYLLDDSYFIFNNSLLNYFRQHNSSTTAQNNKLRKKEIYLENIEYLNYFGQANKYKTLIDHYIKYYIWNNKRSVFKVSFLKKLKTKKYIIPYYYLSLLKFIIHKLLYYGK